MSASLTLRWGWQNWIVISGNFELKQVAELSEIHKQNV
jgi:hypothetical protein